MLHLTKNTKSIRIGKQDFYEGGEIYMQDNWGWDHYYATVTRIEEASNETPVIYYVLNKKIKAGKELRCRKTEQYFVKDFRCNWMTKEYIEDRLIEKMEKIQKGQLEYE